MPSSRDSRISKGLFFKGCRSLEKRKAAAMEVQREIEDMVARGDNEAIVSKIKQFDLCTQEENTTKKRAGLYGISVVTVALY